MSINLSAGVEGGKWIGNLLALVSTLSSALYKVLFKFMVGDASIGTVSAFLSCLGFINLTVSWIVVVVLNVTQTEPLEDILWVALILTALILLIYNFLINFGIAYVTKCFFKFFFLIVGGINLLFFFSLF